ncbi:MAG: hypothetical protein IJ004_03460 [Clostridia bacterium]|nr:hypothetical protein [Clostridia bacterium]
MKKALSLILCLLMLVPCFAWQIVAEEGETTGELENVALYGMTYHSSVFNNDRSSKYLNNGFLWNSYQMWEPLSTGRNVGPCDDTLQYCGMKFNTYYEGESMTIYMKKWDAIDGAFCVKCKKEYKNEELKDLEYKTDSKTGEQVRKSAKCPTCDGEITSFLTDQHNNIKYTIKALIFGEWKILGIAYNNDLTYYVPEGENAVQGGNNAFVEIPFYEYDEEGNLVLDENGDPKPFKANTKNVRIECTEYGRYAKWYTDQGYDPDKSPLWDHWWKMPVMHEVIIMGRKGYKPEFDVPEGALLSTNAALGGFANATSATNARYPGLGNDNVSTTSWKGNNVGGVDEFWIDFDTAYAISTVSLNFGGMSEIDSGVDLIYTLSVKKGNNWTVIKQGERVTTITDVITDKLNADKLKTYTLNEAGIQGVKISFTSSKKNGEDVKPVVNEIIAQITKGTTPEKTIFYADYMTVARKASTATGNLACYGTAYASSSFEYSSISDPSYIMDGNISDDSFSWFAANFDTGTYCGVVLKEAHEITKVVLYFNDAITEGKPEEHVMEFEIQAKVNNQYVTIGSGTSYDADKKSPIVSVEVTPTMTDDIRVVYITNGMVFPYLKELEVYSSDYIYGPYLGYMLDSSRTLHGRYPTEDFATRSAVKRASYLDIISPIEYFDILVKFGIDVEKWI